jgi:Tfp pilus assembly protein PilX
VNQRPRQRGAALLLGLLMLSLLSLLVTQAWSDNRWHMRIASHEISQLRAEAAARSALNWAERWLLTRPGEDRPPACGGHCRGLPILADRALPERPEELAESWWLDNALADGFDPDTGDQVVGRVPDGTPAGRWIIEEAQVTGEDDVPTTVYYRIVARAARVPRGTPVVIESVLARPWGDAAWSDARSGPPDETETFGIGRPVATSETTRSRAGSFCRQPETPGHCGRLSWRRIQ